MIMKKPLMIIIICLFCFIFTACEPIHFYYNYESVSKGAVSVELINYDNPKAKMVSDNITPAKHLDFDFEKMENIGAMKKEKWEDFFELISDEMILNHVRHYNSPDGLCIKIDYDNGDFDIVSELYIGRFNASGEFVEFLGIIDSSEIRKQFEKIINDDTNDYYETQIE